MLFCMICRGEMPEKRARSKHAKTCSDKCQTDYRNRMRQERARRICRLCGRRYRQPRNGGPVLMEHKAFVEKVG
jgi:hypothetical protein